MKPRYKEIPVRNNPGIYKRLKLDEMTQTWKDSGVFRAVRRIRKDGRSVKQQCCFHDIVSAKRFRAGEIDAPETTALPGPEKPMTFAALIEQWKEFHYLKIGLGTKQTYEKRLPNLSHLFETPVVEIAPVAIDGLVKKWVLEASKSKQRRHFSMELDLLKTILNFYRRRVNPRYIVPVFEEHYQAADVSKEAERPVESLSEKELLRFLDDLRSATRSDFYAVALTQFGLGLRVSEVCGLHWGAIDLAQRIARIEWIIIWDQCTWEPHIKKSPKNGKVRYLAIPEAVAVELKKLSETRDHRIPLVFHRDGRPLNRQTIAKAYNRVLARIGVTHMSGTHVLRKTAATLANDITGDFYAVSKVLDHASPEETMRYVKPLDGLKRKVSRALASVLVGTAEKPSATSDDAGPNSSESCPQMSPTERSLRDRSHLKLIKS